MKTSLSILAALVALAVLVPSAVFADLEEVNEGVFVEDFEDGTLDQWGVDQKEQKQALRVPKIMEIIQDEGKATFHLKGNFHNRVYLRDRKFNDFSLAVRMKKTAGSYAGVVVRDHWRIYFQMRCFLCLNSDAKQVESKGELLKSGTAFPGYHDVKVVCAGPLLHAFVDDQPIFQYQIPPGEGRIGFYAHGDGEAYYDNLRIETRVCPERYILVEPEAPDDCLVFSPKENVKLRFNVSNYSDSQQQVSIAVSIKSWGDEVIKEVIGEEVKAGAGGISSAEFDMGRIPAGFYRVDLQASCAGKEVGKVHDLPLAVQDRGPYEYKAPTIPIAAYYKYFNKKSPVYTNTYAHVAARSLKDHHFTAVVADPSFTPETIDIFQSYGIATIARGHFLDHPAVIGTLTKDEPKPDEIEQLKQDYEKLRETTDKPITTCMVGEGIGLGGPADPLVMGRQLNAELRCFRWYGIKKSFYGILHDLKYKGWLPLSSVLRIVEASSDRPYWFVLPSLGKMHHEAYYHKPTPAETTGMMHLALAYGADGILFWAFQSHGSWPCLVDQQSLQPIDGNYAAASEVAASINMHADLIKSLEHIGLDVRCPSPVVDAVPRKSSKDEQLYVYVINKDTHNPVSTRLLLWAELWVLTSVRDVFSGKSLEVGKDEEGYLTVALTLAPGEGQLLATDVAYAPQKK